MALKPEKRAFDIDEGPLLIDADVVVVAATAVALLLPVYRCWCICDKQIRKITKTTRMAKRRDANEGQFITIRSMVAAVLVAMINPELPSEEGGESSVVFLRNCLPYAWCLRKWVRFEWVAWSVVDHQWRHEAEGGPLVRACVCM